MKLIGVTGALGTGKTTVARMFKARGARVLNADKIAYGALKKGTGTSRRISKIFGENVLKKSGAIDRKRLASAAFVSNASISKLNAIVHPYVKRAVREAIKAELRRAKPRHIVIDAPLLFEAGMASMADTIIVVAARHDVRTARCLRRGDLTCAEVRRRAVCQLPLKRKMRLADFIIDNNGRIRETKEQARKIWEEIKNG